jgi:hypothetical protein
MRFASCRIAAVLLVALLGSAVGCASIEEDTVGTVGLELVGQAPSGTVYRLRDAIITVHGPSSNTIWNTENAPDQTSLSANVVVGDYSASVQAGWRLERIDGSVATTVAAQLASDNPVQFTVTALQRTSVPLQFRVNAEVVDMSQGYDIVVTIQESPPLLVVANTFSDGSGPPASVEVFAASANGNVSPIRAIGGPSSGVFFPSGVAVAGDQLIVCDEAGSISFYPTTATGEVAPSRRISGPSTGLSFPIGIAVFDGEIYVAQAGGPIVVFPLTAAGDVPPSRTLFPAGTPQGLAVDRGELYVVSSSSGIMVYPTTAVGFPQPSRTIFPTNGFCPNGIIARGGEIFLTDGCDAGVRVFPEAASGSVSPLRTIAGPRTGLIGATGIARFGGELYVSDVNTHSVRVFPASADGDVFPTRAITGARTNITFPLGVSLF